MATREIIRIDEELCDGCGLCVPACAEGALKIIEGKARLVSEIYCDGLGACLGECPQGAISMEKREAADFDEAAVEEHLAQLEKTGTEVATKTFHPGPESVKNPDLACGCPGSAMRTFSAGGDGGTVKARRVLSESEGPGESGFVRQSVRSALGHWPVQLRLVPAGAPFLRQADILICADCVPFTVPDFHSRYLNGRSVVVGCPKLDNLDVYREKLYQIFSTANPRSITVLRMEVPCCGGISHAAVEARDRANLDLPVRIETLGIRGGSQIEISNPREAVASGGA